MKSMKTVAHRRIAALVPLVLLLALMPVAAQDADSPAPAAVFDELVHDFGQVSRGEKLTHVFVIRNEGNAPLEVLNVKPG